MTNILCFQLVVQPGIFKTPLLPANHVLTDSTNLKSGSQNVINVIPEVQHIVWEQ